MISFAATVPAVLVVVAIARFVVVAISRLFLHPLRDVPGPKLAAITSAYEFYYECILTGRYHFKVNELHGEYGELMNN